MRIAVIVEGRTEKVLADPVRQFLRSRLPPARPLPSIVFRPCRGCVPTGQGLQRMVQDMFRGHDAFDFVLALTDVYTGMRDFDDAADAIAKMREWVGPERRFSAHAAQYEIEAWLLPYWDRIRALARSNRASPGPNPEAVNHDKPPSRLLNEVYRTGERRKSYDKVRDALRILDGQDLAVAANACPQLKVFLNRLLELAGAPLLP